MNPRALGVLQIVLASLCFGFLGLFSRWAAQLGLDTGTLLTARFTFATLVLFTFFLLFRKTHLKISKSQFVLCFGLGVLGYAVFSTLYFWSIERVSVALAVMLLYTNPFWVHLISHLMGEKMKSYEWGALFVASLGLVLLLWGEVNVKSVWGILSGAGSAITYAVYILVSQKYQQKMNPWTVSVYVMFSAALALFVFHRPLSVPIFEFNFQQLGLVFLMAVFSTILPLSLVLASLQKLSSSRVSLLSLTEPMTAVIAAALVFNEQLSLSQWTGCALILAALAGKTVYESRLTPVSN